MTAPEIAASLSDRILAVIAKAASQHPMRAADVLALVGGEEPPFWAAIEQLYRERRINTAHIQKKGDTEPWLGVWPTGVCLPVPPMSGNSFAGLFVKHRADDLYAAHAPRSTPKPAVAPTPAPKHEPIQESTDMETARKKGQLQTDFGALLAGIPSDKAVRLAAAAKTLGCSVEALRHAARALVKKGFIVETPSTQGGRVVTAFYDPATDRASAPVEKAEVAESETAAPAVDRRAPQPLYRDGDLTVNEVAVHEPSPKIEFALWDDGRLVIADGDEIIQIPRDATRRLAQLLGVPGTNPVSNLGA